MNRTQYRQARRMIRDNGRYALRWMDDSTRTAMDYLLFCVQDAQDWLAERADIVAHCRREGLYCNPRMTGRIPPCGRRAKDFAAKAREAAQAMAGFQGVSA